jgi:hypothetical protein
MHIRIGRERPSAWSRRRRARSGGEALVLAVLILGWTAVLPLVESTPAWAETRGKFVIACGFVRALPDDPIVHPGDPGASHLHDFFGNLSTDANATRTRMLDSNTSCRDWDDTAGYWSPVGYLNGEQITPIRQRLYYLGSVSGSVNTFPADLRMIAGDPTATSAAKNRHVAWSCGGGSTPLSTHPYDCTPYQGLSGLVDGIVGNVDFPECWDGANLDSADHTSHMSYVVKGACPADHPVRIPSLRLRVHFGVWDPCEGATPCGPNDPDDNVALSLSSGPYYTLHADFWNTWKQGALDSLVTACLNAHISCATPTALTPGAASVAAQAGDSVVHLSWVPPTRGGSGIDGYIVYRATAPGPPSELASVGLATTYDDTSVTNGTTYEYVVRAQNVYGPGRGSRDRAASPASVPSAPVLTATAESGVVHLAWTAPDDGGSAIRRYRIYRATTCGAEIIYAREVGISWDDFGVTSATTYCYQVSAVNRMGAGPRSNEVTATPG